MRFHASTNHLWRNDCSLIFIDESYVKTESVIITTYDLVTSNILFFLRSSWLALKASNSAWSRWLSLFSLRFSPSLTARALWSLWTSSYEDISQKFVQKNRVLFVTLFFSLSSHILLSNAAILPSSRVRCSSRSCRRPTPSCCSLSTRTIWWAVSSLASAISMRLD